MQQSTTTSTSQSTAHHLPFSKGAETKTNSGVYPSQNIPAYYATLLDTASTTSTTSHLPHIWSDTSMQLLVSPQKTHYLQRFAMAISPHFPCSLQPMSWNIFQNPTRCRKGTWNSFNRGCIPPNWNLPYHPSHQHLASNTRMYTSASMMPQKRLCTLIKPVTFLSSLDGDTNTSWWPLNSMAITSMPSAWNHAKPMISSRPTRPYINAGMTPRSFTWTGTSSTMRHLRSWNKQYVRINAV